METSLITTEVACVIAAIVGEGLKAFAIEIPVRSSTRRQTAFGAFGVMLLRKLPAPGPHIGHRQLTKELFDPLAMTAWNEAGRRARK